MSTYNDASLIYYPSGYKASKAYSLKPTDGSGDLTFTRASTATRVNESGLIESVATGVPRIDYTGGGCGKLLLEPQRTNSQIYSQDFTNATYIKDAGITVTSTNNTSPSGALDATKISVTNSGRIYSNVASNTWCTSVFLKAGTFAYFELAGKKIDLNLGTMVGGTIEDYGNGWYRVTGIATTTRPFQIIAYPNSSYATHTTSGDYFIWCVQSELSATYPTSYIPTTSTAVTRVADSASKSGISSLIGQTEGTIYLEGDIQKHNESGFYVTISNGATINTAIYAYQPSNGNLQVLVRKSGNPDATLTITSANWTAGFNKLAIAYTSTTAEVFINGVSKGTTSFVSAPACSKFTIGSRPDAVGTLVGTGGYNQTLLFKTRLTNAQLAALTTL